MPYFKHPNAIVESEFVGDKTRIWAFAHILPGAVIGEDCNICDHTFIENDVIIGNRVTIKCGVQLWDGIRIEDDVFIGPNVTFTNDPFPRSKHYPEKFLTTVVKKGASIGANATILPGVDIGQSAMVGAGAVVTKNVPPHAIVVGNPARITGYQNKENRNLIETKNIRLKGNYPLITGVKIIEFPYIKDMRGSLSVTEWQNELPFEPKRVFWIFDVPDKEVRGEHAHKKLHEVLVCIKGTCSLMLDNGNDRIEISLDSPNIGVYIPPMIWSVQYKYSKDAIVLVFASEIYEPDDYIRNYDEYLIEMGIK